MHTDINYHHSVSDFAFYVLITEVESCKVCQQWLNKPKSFICAGVNSCEVIPVSFMWPCFIFTVWMELACLQCFQFKPSVLFSIFLWNILLWNWRTLSLWPKRGQMQKMTVFLFCSASLLIQLVKRMFLRRIKLLIQQLFSKMDCIVAWILETNVACSFHLEVRTLVSF